MALSNLFRWLRRSGHADNVTPRKAARLRLESLEERTVPSATSLVNQGFESPGLTLGKYSYSPIGSGWDFAGTSGVSSNASGFTAANPNAVQGTQVGFVQSQGSISQTAFFMGGTYDISFQAAQRAVQNNLQTFQVMIDGVVVGTFNNVAGNGYTLQNTSTFNLAEGNHTITFLGTNLNGGDTTVFLDQVFVNQHSSGLSDSGFEMLAVAAGAYSYNPAGTAWTYTGYAGVASNGSGFTVINPNAPQASQVAFLQTQGSISQSVFFDEGIYDISFAAAQRGGQSGYQTFQVLVDGVVVGTYNNLTSAAYTQQATTTFSVAGGIHTITFQGTNLNGGDNTVFIDEVYITRFAAGPSDSGFEMAAQARGAFSYNATGSAWTFLGTSGVSSNGSGFTGSNPYAPQASQVAFLQSQGSFSQTSYFEGGAYEIVFSAAQRTGQRTKQTFQVLVDGYVVGTFNNLSSNAYTQLSSSTFSMAAGLHTMTFQGTNLNGGDSTVFIEDVLIHQQVSGVSDSGFESPALSSGAFAYRPEGTDWTYLGNAGVASNGSAFTSSNPSAPQGSQAAFVQTTGAMTQSAFFEQGAYDISFLAAQRAGKLSKQTFQVLVDGTIVGTYNNLAGTAYAQLNTTSFILTAGYHTVAFVGTNLYGGDNTVFIDAVTVNRRESTIADAGFEAPYQAEGSFSYIPAGSPWSFGGTAGVSANGSGFTNGTPQAPQGGQVAFLQGTGAMSQTAFFETGTYNISFAAAQRAGQTSLQTFSVLVDGIVVGVFNAHAGNAYSLAVTANFTLVAGNHNVTFQATNLNGGDNTVFVDQVYVNRI